MTIFTAPSDPSSGNSSPENATKPITTSDLFILFQELLNSTRSQAHQPTVHLGQRLPTELPKFYGRPNESLSMWLFQIENIFSTRHLFGHDRLPYLSSCLGEAALAWLHNWSLSSQAHRTQPFLDWEDFVASIKLAFEPPRQQQHLRAQLRLLRQSSSAQAYTYSFRNILGQITSMHEDDRLSYYLHGLSNKLRGEVEVREPKDLEEAVKIAITIDSLRHGVDTRIPAFDTHSKRPPIPNSFSSAGNKERSTSPPVPMELGSISQKTKNTSIKNKSTDYYTKFCSKCPRYGHTDAECRTHPASVPPRTVNAIEAPFVEESDINKLAENYLAVQNGKPNDLIIFNG